MQQSLIDDNFDNILYNILVNKEDFIPKEFNIIYQITTTDNQKLIE